MKYLQLFCILTVLCTACNKDDNEPTPAQNIIGKWTIYNSVLLGQNIPGDGSCLTFNACSGTCSGTDFRASDTTYGTITYVLNEDASYLYITDTSGLGGSYNGTWDVLELTEDKLRIVGSTFFGDLKLEMDKD